MQIGPYTIERELGRGGMGAVYLGRTQGALEPVAIKVLHASLSGDPEIVARFHREGEILESLSHPNLVKLRARGTFSGGLWLAMDYVPGESLAQRLKRTGPLPSPEARELLLALCAGVSHAHASGVLHRDLKPTNVLLRESDGAPLIVDFGIALPLDVSQHLTATGTILGSPGYLAPEQCGVGQPPSPATDVYGLGGVLYAALTGHPPLQGASLIATLDQVLNANPRAPRALVPGLDPALEAVCLRCLAKDPSERYAGPDELAAALREKRAAPRRAPLLALAASAVGLAGVLGLAASGLVSDPPATPAESAQATSLASAPPSPSPAQLPLASRVEHALESQAWGEGHRALDEVETLEAVWLRWRLLAAELNAQGEGSPSWEEKRTQALKVAKRLAGQSPQPWARALVALTRGLHGLLSSEVLTPTELGALGQELEEGLLGSSAATPKQRLALIRLAALVSGRELEASPGRSDVAKRTTKALERWEGASGESWRVHLGYVGLYRRPGAERWQSASSSLDEAEFAAARAGHPWGRLVVYWLRTTLTRKSTEEINPRQSHLLRFVLASPQAPLSLRARAALVVGYGLLQEDRAADALALLLAHAPPLGGRGSFPTDYATVLGLAYLRSGQAARAREVLEVPGLQARRLAALLAIALAHLGERDLARLQLDRRPEDPNTGAHLLLLEASALNEQIELVEDTLDRIEGTHQVNLRLRAVDALRRALAAKTDSGAPVIREPARIAKLVDELLRPAKLYPSRTVHDLLAFGRWRMSLRWIERDLRARGRTSDSSLAARLAYRSLLRGRDEVEASEESWRRAQEIALQAAQEDHDDSVEGRGLHALLEVAGVPAAGRLNAIEEALLRALKVRGEWPELHEGYQRVLDSQASRGAQAGRRAVAYQALVRWLELKPHSPPALLRLADFEQDASRQIGILERVSSLSQAWVGLRASQDQLQLEVQVRRMLPQIAAARLSVLTLDRAVALRGQRRRLLLDSAEQYLDSEGYAQQALVTLERLEASCGVPPGGENLIRFEFSKMQALSKLGRREEAIRAGERALAATRGREDRAQAMAALGRLEIRAGFVQRGRTRIKRAVREAPSTKTWVELARASDGLEQRGAYVKALGFPFPPERLPKLLDEIHRANYDERALSREAYPTLECRGLALGALNLGFELYRQQPDAESALLLWEGYLIAEQNEPLALNTEGEATLSRARADLTAPAQTLVDAQRSLAAILARPAEGTFAHLLAALTALRTAAEGVSIQVSDRLRVPSGELKGIEALSFAAPAAERETYTRAALKLLEAWRRRPNSDARIPSWIAHFQCKEGEFARAIETLRGALAAPRLQAEVRHPMEFDLAATYRWHGQDEKALLSLARHLDARSRFVPRSAGLLLRGKILTSRGDVAGAKAALEEARALVPPGDLPVRYSIDVAWVRFLILAGRIPDASREVARLRPLRQWPVLPDSQAELTAVDAELARRGGNATESLRLSDAALVLDPTCAGALSERVEALCALGRGREALAYAKSQAENKALRPRAQQRLAALAVRLSESD